MPLRRLCAASRSFITGHDGLHQLVLTKQGVNISLSFSLLPYLSTIVDLSSHIFVHMQDLSLTKVWYCGPNVLSATITQEVLQTSAIHQTFCHGPSHLILMHSVPLDIKGSGAQEYSLQSYIISQKSLVLCSYFIPRTLKWLQCNSVP